MDCCLVLMLHLLMRAEVGLSDNNNDHNSNYNYNHGSVHGAVIQSHCKNSPSSYSTKWLLILKPS